MPEPGMPSIVTTKGLPVLIHVVRALVADHSSHGQRIADQQKACMATAREGQHGA